MSDNVRQSGQSVTASERGVRVDFSDLTDYENRRDVANGIDRWPLLFQDAVWLNSEGRFVFIKDIHPDYLRNLYRWLRRFVKSIPYPNLNGDMAQFIAEREYWAIQEEWPGFPLFKVIAERLADLGLWDEAEGRPVE